MYLQIQYIIWHQSSPQNIYTESNMQGRNLKHYLKDFAIGLVIHHGFRINIVCYINKTDLIISQIQLIYLLSIIWE